MPERPGTLPAAKRIHSVEAWRVSLPLTLIYHLSFGDISRYETVFVKIVTGAGRQGWGESTNLFGYGNETSDFIWQAVRTLSGPLPGHSFAEALGRLRTLFSEHPFSHAAVLGALEALENGCSPSLEKALSVPLTGIVNEETPAALEKELDTLMRSGFRTLKVKVGKNAAADAERVNWITRWIPEGFKIRLDANQGYGPAEAGFFTQKLSHPARIELLEQPFPVEAWDAMASFSPQCPVVTMLDESISRKEDIDKAAAIANLGIVKLKLVKCGGSRQALLELARHAHSKGLKVILGNGVAADLDCLTEGRLWQTIGDTDFAGEMNGYLKLCSRLLPERLGFEKGAMVLLPGGENFEGLAERLKPFTVDHFCLKEKD